MKHKRRKLVFSPLGKVLKEMRLKRGLSQKDVSDELGFSSPQFISNFERGHCGLPLNVIKKLAEFYRVNPKKIIKILVLLHQRYLEEILC